MSEIEFDQKLDRIIEMLIQNFLPNKEVFNSKEAGLYMGLSPDYVCTLARQGKFPSSRPNNGKRFYKRTDLHFWLLLTDRISSISNSEVKKLLFLNPGKN